MMDATTPLVLLHAFPFSSAMYSDLVAALDPAGRPVYTPDLRGFGGTPLGADEPSLDLMADDVARYLDANTIDNCVLGGVSMGGYVAMAMLRRHPERVSAVLLIDTTASADTDEGRQHRYRMADAVLDRGMSHEVHPMVESMVGETTHRDRRDVVAKVRGWIAAANPEAVAWAQRAMAVRPESFDTLRSATTPAAVIVGDEDVKTPLPAAEAMAAAFEPPVPVHVIPTAGHLAVVEAPAVVAGAISDAFTRFTS